MAKLEDLLKAQGFTDVEIAANAALLQDPKLRGALETSYGKLEQDLTTFRTENEGWGKWHEEHGKPTLALYEKDRADAIAEAAGLRARLALAVEGGFVQPGTVPAAAAPVVAAQPATPAAFDPKAYKLLTQDDAAGFAIAQGRAMAKYQDISSEHFRLFGKPLENFGGEEGLYEKFLKRPNKEQTIQGMWEAQYNVQAKRDEIAAAQKLAAENAIREDERSKLAAQYGNPNVREMMPSINPFMPQPAEGEFKQPWEGGRTVIQAKNLRLERAMQTQMKAAG